jgi:hypothetical protein
MTILGYIDPGTGGVVLQLLLAAMVGVIYRFRRFLAKLFKSFGTKK